jgi:hypothetical protein
MIECAAMRARGLAVLVVVAMSGCGNGTAAPSGPGLTLAPSIIVPQDLIGQLVHIYVSVYPSKSEAGVSVSCSTTTAGALAGQVDAAVPEPGFPFRDVSGSGSCDGGFSRCAPKLTVEVSPSPQIFYAIGVNGSGTTLASGCTSAIVDPMTKDAAAIPQTILITLQPIIPPATCGNGIVEVGETCDPGSGATDPECNAKTCQTVEQVLSVGSSTTNTINMPGAGHVSTPAFTWPLGGDFLASFTDNSSANNQVEMRLLGPSLTSSVGTAGPAENFEFILPNASAFPSTAAAENQKQPQTVILGTVAYTVFADDNGTSDGSYDIHLRSTDLTLLTNQQSNPCGINGPSGGGETGDQTSPMMAVSNNNLFIAWQESSGVIAGRMYTPAAGGSGACGTLGAQIALTGSNVSLAGIPQGWVAVWQNGNAIQSQAISTSGGLVGLPTKVNTSNDSAQTPTIAAITPFTTGISTGTNVGAFAIAWSDQSTGQIVAQRYKLATNDAGSSADLIVGDQGSATLDNLIVGSNGTPNSTPFIAASSLAGGSYVVTWVDSTSSHAIHARLLAGTAGSLQQESGANTGYLLNGITGTTDEFQVSLMGTNGDARNTPVVAVGGSGPYMAFGWVDTGSANNYGIIGRRFPFPSQSVP